MPFWDAAGTTLIAYASDEEVVAKARRDFYAVTPEDNLWAYGDDGVIPADASWDLTSAAVDFAAARLLAGMVVLLSEPKAVFGDGGEVLAVDSVDVVDRHRLHLRRVGVAAGGQAPGYPGAATTAVAFEVRTMLPQLLNTSADLDAEFQVGGPAGFDPYSGQTAPSRARENLEEWSLRQLNALCLWDTLRDLYVGAAQSMGAVGATPDVWAQKARLADQWATQLRRSFRPRFRGGGESQAQQRFAPIVRW